MPCNATHFHSMCRVCTEISTACIGNKASLYIPRTSLLQPADTTPIVFDITYLQTKPFRYTLDGDVLGQEIRKALEPWLIIEKEQVRRFHMWIRADYDELKEPQTPSTVSLKVSILVDINMSAYGANAGSIIKSLPTKIVNRKLGVNFRLHGEWVAWMADEEEHGSSYRLKWFAELVEAKAPFMMWSNFALNDVGDYGHVDNEDFAEHLVYIPTRHPNQKRRAVSERRRSASQVQVGQSEGCSLM